jgi:hypothetical protein
MGFRLSGERPFDHSGVSVSAAGDINADGFDDVIIGSLSSSEDNDKGASYVLFGAPAVQLNPNALLFLDPDGDVVTIGLSGAEISAKDVTRAQDGTIASIDLTQIGSSANALHGKAQPINLSISVTQSPNGTGDGLTNVGFLNAIGVDLGKVSLHCNLRQIIAGSGSGKAAVKLLSIVGNLGATGAEVPQLSHFFGTMPKLTVGGSLQMHSIQVDGRVKVITIGGDLVGGPGPGVAALGEIAMVGIDGYVAQGNPTPAGIFLAESIGVLRIGGSFQSGGIVATRDLGSVSVTNDFAGRLYSGGSIKSVRVGKNLISNDFIQSAAITARDELESLVIGGNVENVRILIGYGPDEQPVNADAGIAKVTVKGDWIASDLSAGIFDSTADGFGRNDGVIFGDSTPSLLSTIASVVIKGTASGSSAAGDHFGITAQHIGRITIGGTNTPLTKSRFDDFLLDEINGDFRIVEIG